MRFYLAVVFLVLLSFGGWADESLPFLELRYSSHDGWGSLRYDTSMMFEEAEYPSQPYQENLRIWSALIQFPYKALALRFQFDIENYSDLTIGNGLMPTMKREIQNSIGFSVALRYYLRRGFNGNKHPAD